jgi:tetratricopeptide (TPR) repeat protein
MSVTVPDFDALWDYGDPAGTEGKFRDLQPGSAHWDVGPRAELLTQIARTFSLRREFETAHALLDEAVELLAGHDRPRARVRVLLERGRCFNSARQKDRAIPIFIQAWELGREAGEDGLAVDAAHMVAIAETDQAAVDWNLQALALATTSPDPRAQRWVGSLQNNLGWAYHARGEFETALDYFERNEAWHTARQSGEPLRIARWCVARTQRSLGRLEETLAGQQALAAAGAEDGYVSEELAENLEALGRHDEAKPHFARAYALLSQDKWLPTDEPERLARLKRLGE